MTGTNSEYCFWEVGSWQPGHRIPTHFEGDLPGAVTFARDGTLMAIRYSSTVLHLIDPARGRQLAALESPDRNLIEMFSFSPDGSHLVGVDLRKRGYAWNLRLIRQQLAEIGLDWDLPSYPPAAPIHNGKPLRVEVELGSLSANKD